MKRALPFLLAVLAFFAARHGRPDAPPTVAAESARQPAAPRNELRGLARRADRLAGEQVGSIADLVRLARSGSLSASDLAAVVARAAGIDPEGTWEWVNGQEIPASQRSNYRQIVARAWFPKDPEAVLGRLDAGRYEDWRIAGSLVGLLFSKDKAESAAASKHLDALVALSSPAPSSFFLPSDEGAAALLLGLPEGRSRDILTRQYATWWLERDLAGAQAWMENLTAAARNEVLGKFAAQAIHPQGSTTPEARAFAAAWIENEASPADHARLGPALVESMAKEDPAAALDWASKNLSAAPLAEATGKVVARLFASDPDHARDLVAGLPPGNLRHRAAADLAFAWIGKEPAAAVDWWLSQVGPAEAAKSTGITASSRLGDYWFRADPDSLRARLGDPDQAPLPMSLASSALRQWARKDPAATLEWAATLPADRQQSFVRATYDHWAYEDPTAAAAAITRRLDFSPPESAGKIASIWFREDQAASIRWTAALPEGPARAAALESLKSAADFEVQLGGTFPPALQELLD